VLDPIFRAYFTDSFCRALDAHVKTEFPRLRDLLARQPKPRRGADYGVPLPTPLQKARGPVAATK
jgi:hypothetical protein